MSKDRAALRDAKTQDPPPAAEGAPEGAGPPDPTDLVSLLVLDGIEAPAAALLVGYLTVRHGPDGRPVGMPSDVLAYARQLRQQPMVWSALLATDYIRLARALDICGLPGATAGELQEAASAAAV